MVHEKLRPADVYDKEDVYKATIEPKVRDLMLGCMSERLPMFVSVAVKNSEGGTSYVNNVVLGATSIRLKDNRIARILLHINSFPQDTIPEDVDAALNTLCRYLSTIGGDETFADSSEDGVVLTDDLLNSFRMIAKTEDPNGT